MKKRRTIQNKYQQCGPIVNKMNFPILFIFCFGVIVTVSGFSSIAPDNPFKV
jgi:hypothetical protein